MCSFGAQVHRAGAVFRNADECFEHQVELADRRKVAFAAHGAVNLVLDDVVGHLFVGHACHGYVLAVFCLVFLNQVVGTVTCFATFAIHKGVGKSAEVTACFPCFGVHQYCAVYTYVKRVFLYKLAVPHLLDVVFHFNAKRTVVPRVGQSAVDFAAGIHKAATFGKVYKFVHGKLSHICILLLVKKFVSLL